MTLNKPKASIAAVALLSLMLPLISSCSETSEDTATTTADESLAQAPSDSTPPGASSPDPAFDPLLSTLEQMTTAPIMLPASLPPQLKSVAIGNDANESSPYTTSGDKYTILFLNPDSYPPPDPTQTVQPYAHYRVSGTLTASPASAPPRPDPSSFGAGGATVHQLGTVTIPTGAVADLWRIDPPEGANYVPFTVGMFEDGGERYTVRIEIDTPEGDLARQILSTMVRVPST